MISFDEFLKQDDEEKYNNAQMDIFEIQALKDELKNRDIYISKLEVAYSKEIERLNKEIIGLNNCIIEFHSEFCNKQAEINRLNNIIKEVREIFKDYGKKEDIVGYTMYNITGEMLIKLLEILDKTN